MMNNPNVAKFSAITIGIVVFIGLVFVYFTIFGTRAADYEPRDVVISNIEKNSARATWATGVETQGVIEYGTTPSVLNFFAPESAKSSTHSLDLTLLSPNTTYYFNIRVGETKYDNGGVPWTFTTKGVGSAAITPDAIVITNTAAAPTSVVAPTTSVTGTSTIRITQAPVSNNQPTPFQRIQVSDGTNCTETDCAKIKLKLGKGCSTQDYFKCMKKLTPTP